MQFRKSTRLFASASLLALAACSGGGGGGGGTGGSIVNGPVVTPPASNISITPVTALGYGGATPTEATGPTPNFNGSLPPNGTVFALNQGAIAISSKSAGGVNAGAGTATVQGSVTSGSTLYPLLDLKIPNIGINVTGLRGDGTEKTQADGSTVSTIVFGLNYTLLGAWTYKPAGGGSSTIGLAVTGYQTPAGSVPTTGTAAYAGGGDVIGTVAIPSGTGGISGATLSGNVNLSVNFSSQQVTGTLSNMTAKDVLSNKVTPWNNVSLTGNLSQTAGSANRGAIITGTTQAQSAPSGADFGMSSGATGNLSGALFGPDANEAGGVWSVNEGSGANGKTAFGMFGATKQ
jgi:hypothetical protein